MSALNTLKVKRIDLSLEITKMFCQNSDYETMVLIQNGINLDKRTSINVLEVYFSELDCQARTVQPAQTAVNFCTELKLFFRRRSRIYHRRKIDMLTRIPILYVSKLLLQKRLIIRRLSRVGRDS